ncbi:MAG: CDP-diacylglycerol--glycerol-3-phosphate 3-phosphatidyltransferase [Candidatus Cloacimonetes bacterium]|nr:CDP-diacylglycerol--glycerol-3-phosphate 3-phosphatidyltransferase [Candidatus Cloacimonadota bacterium]
MKKKIPNFLTILRIIFVPIFIILMFKPSIENNVLWATIIFIVASITDYFDGLLARKFQTISNFGKLMDPLADKILVISALIALSIQMNYIHIIALLIIVFREISVTILRNIYAKKGVFVAANIWGKIKTILQMVGIILALLYYSVFHEILRIVEYDQIIGWIFNLYFWIITAITLFSGMNYFMIKQNKR